MDVTAGPLGDPGQGAAAAWGDFDNDRDLDLYVCNADGPNHLLRNDGALGFVEATPLGLDDVGPGTGVSWLDYDNDGWLDLYFANAPGSNHLFRNIGSGFLDMTVAPLDAPGSESATCVADFDNDGDVDLFLASHEAGSPNLLLRNDLVGANRWLQVDLHGTASNRFGVGARLRVVAAGTSQIRAIAAGYGRYAQDSFTAHFGLGVAAAVDTLEIQWPSGIRQTVTELAVDQRVTVLEDANSTAARPRATSRQFALHAASPNPFNPTTTLKFGLPATLHVRLHIYDVAGRLVRTLVDEARPAGEHLTVWDGRGDNGAATASGVYHARLEAGAAVRTMRLVLVR
jgi:hypothetical protein